MLKEGSELLAPMEESMLAYGASNLATASNVGQSGSPATAEGAGGIGGSEEDTAVGRIRGGKRGRIRNQGSERAACFMRGICDLMHGVLLPFLQCTNLHTNTPVAYM